MKKANISGTRIKEAREKLGLKQIDVVAALEVECDIDLGRPKLSEIENGTRGVKDYELVALAQILNVGVEWLVGEDENL